MANSALRLDVVINAIAQDISAIAQTSAAIREAQAAADSFFGTLRLGAGIDISHRIIEGFIELAGSIKGLIQTGVEFNSTLENTQIGIAAILRQTDKVGNFTNFNDAMSASGQIIGQLKIQADALAVPFQAMASSYQIAATQMSQAGIPIKDQVELIGLLTRAVQVQLGPLADSRQILTETRAVLQGQLTPGSQLANSLIGTPESKAAFNQAKDNGQLFQFFQDHLKGVKEAADLTSASFTGLSQRLANLTQQFGGAVAAPLFDQLKIGALSLVQAFKDPTLVNSLKPFSDAVATIAGETITNLTGLIPVVADFARSFGPAFNVLSDGFKDSLRIIGDGVFQLSAIFADSKFVKEFKDSMDGLKAASQPAIDAFNAILAAGVQMVIDLVKTLPAIIDVVAEFAPIFTIALDAIKIFADGIQIVTGFVADHNEIAKIALETIVGIGLAYAVFTTAGAVVQLVSFTASMIASTVANTVATVALFGTEVATFGLAGAIRVLNLAIAANPFGLILIGITAIAGFFATKWVANQVQAKLSVDDVTESVDKLQKKEDEAFTKLGKDLKDLKPPPLATSGVQAEELLKRQADVQKTQAALQEEGDRIIFANEANSFAERLKAEQDFYKTKIAQSQANLTIESKIIADEMDHSTLDQRQKLLTRLTALKDSASLEVTKLQNTLTETVTKLTAQEQTRNDKISEAALLRGLENQENVLISRQLDSDVGVIEHGIELEKLTNQIISEREITHSKITDSKKFEAAITKAQSDAETALSQKEKAGNRDYLTGLSQRVSQQLAENTGTKEHADIIKLGIDAENSLVEAQRKSNSTGGQSVDLQTKLNGLLADQLAFNQKIANIRLQQGQLDLNTAEATTDTVREQLDLRSTPESIDQAKHNQLVQQKSDIQGLITLENDRQLALFEAGKENSDDFIQSQIAVEGLNQKLIDTQHQLQVVGSFSGTVQEGIQAWANSFGTVGTQFSKFLSGAFNSTITNVSTGIKGLINGTKSFKDVWNDVLGSILDGLIQMVVTFIAQHLVMLAFKATFNSGMLSLDGAFAAAETVIFAPLALLKSISTFGLAAVIGLAALLAVGGAALAGAFADGGLVPGSPVHHDNQIASVGSGEFIHKTAAVQYYGPDFMNAVNDMRIPRERLMGAVAGISMTTPIPRTGAFSLGGLVGSSRADELSQAGSTPTQIVNQISVVNLDKRNEIRDYMQSSDGQKVMYRSTKRRGMELGIRT